MPDGQVADWTRTAIAFTRALAAGDHDGAAHMWNGLHPDDRLHTTLTIAGLLALYVQAQPDGWERLSSFADVVGGLDA